MARKSKQRKWDLNSQRKAMKAKRTDASRDKRLANKKKREAIHAIDPDMKVDIVNQVTYDKEGAEIKIDNGNLTKWLPEAVPKNLYVPSALPEGAIKTECDSELDDEVIEATMKFCNEPYIEDEHAAAEELAKYDDEVLGMSVTAEEPRKVILRNDPAKRTIHCRMCGKVREYIQTTLCNMCSELQANEDELRRKDHERAMRPREAIKVDKPTCELPKLKKKGMLNVIKDKLRISNEG